ncbi:MAG: 3-deoxy-manno-octulosonate cytidylyltransferase [Dehalococcoidales bacterium]|jgi:3-deoxy-manno-octulosonate cytidylyltransferase (CMP-KDO synthetase)
MKIIGVIPARFKSSRFPGKPLADICGRPLVWWVYRQAVKVKELNKVYVATDDGRIALACKKLGIPYVMTSGKHPTGTDRVAEVARKVKADIYVNIQGDEPLLEPAMIKSAIRSLLKGRSGFDVTNLMSRIRNPREVPSPTVPKVAVNVKGDAVFLSRAPIPYPKRGGDARYYKQVCVYGFRRKALLAFGGLPRGASELIEDIELLRFIENGIKVRMIEVKSGSMAVDTPSDLEAVRKIICQSRA